MFSSSREGGKSAPKARSLIVESKNISDLKKYHDNHSTYIFDLDNTVFHPTESLGSAQWYKHFLMFAHARINNESEAREITILIHRAVQYTIIVQAVDPAVRDIVNSLNRPALAVTARGDDIADVTAAQLNSVGVDFSKQWRHNAFHFTVDENRTAYYKDGVIYCAGYDKGKCLAAFYKTIGLRFPQKVVMTDDEEKNLLSVKRVAEQFSSDFVGLRYAYLDDVVAKFDINAANNQLIAMRNRLADEAKQAVDRLHTTSHHRQTRIHSFTMQSFFAVAKNDVAKKGIKEKPLEPIGLVVN